MATQRFDPVVMVTNATRAVQEQKADISRRTIKKLQLQERWPEEYVMWTGRLASNTFKDAEKFYAVQIKRHKNFMQRWTFVPVLKGQLPFVINAAEDALDLIQRQYAKMIDTGMYGRNISMFSRVGAVRRKITSVQQMIDAGEGASIQFTSLVSYASTLEVNALYYQQHGGMLYHVAKKLRRKYASKPVGIRFGYEKAEAFGAGHKYDLPVITIGTLDIVKPNLTTPGKNYRRRKGIRERLTRARDNA